MIRKSLSLLFCGVSGAALAGSGSPGYYGLSLDSNPVLRSCVGPMIGQATAPATCGKIGASWLLDGASAGNLGFTPLAPANNLSEVSSAATARANLGLSASAAAGGPRYNVRDYCAGACTTVAQRTAAFQAVAGLLNASGGAGATMYIPPGKWDYDASASGPMVITAANVSVIGDGVNSAVVRVYNGSFLKWSFSTTDNTVGTIRDFRLYESDNPAAGVLLSLTNVNLADMSNVMLGGGCVNLELASAVGVHGTNITIEGNNTNGSCSPGSVATGVTGLWIHKAATGIRGNNSENNFTNLNVRSSTFYQMKNAIVISNSDGLVITNGHAGMTSGDVVLYQPEYAGDFIDNVHLIGISTDANLARGHHFAPYSGTGDYVGVNLNNIISTALVSNSASDGILVEDPAVQKLEIIGVTLNYNTGNAINIQAGNNISITGGSYSQNAKGNTTGSGTHYSDVLIGGTASHVAIDGGTYKNGLSDSAPEYHVLVQDGADYVVVGPASYQGASLGDVHKTVAGDGVGHVATGTHIPTPVAGVTDQGANQVWPVFKNITSSGGYLSNGYGTNVFTWQGTSLYNSNVNIVEVQAVAGPAPARVFATGTSGLAAPLMIGDNGGTTTGIVYLGNETGGTSTPGPAKFIGGVTLTNVGMTVGPFSSFQGGMNVGGSGSNANYLTVNGGAAGQPVTVVAHGDDADVAVRVAGQGAKGLQAGHWTSTVDPTTVTVPSGYCVDWNNTTAGTYKHVCNFGGTLKSVSLN